MNPYLHPVEDHERPLQDVVDAKVVKWQGLIGAAVAWLAITAIVVGAELWH